MRLQVFIGLLLAVVVAGTAAQDSSALKPYELAQAYQIYDLLLPKQEAYALTKDTLLIREQTVSDDAWSPECVTPEAKKRFSDAITALLQGMTTKWLLLPRFEIPKPYKLVGQDDLAALPNGQSQGPYIEMSVVGFNRDATRAIVFIASKCGGLCGSSGYHLLEKEHGKWKEVQGVICLTAS